MFCSKKYTAPAIVLSVVCGIMVISILCVLWYLMTHTATVTAKHQRRPKKSKCIIFVNVLFHTSTLGLLVCRACLKWLECLEMPRVLKIVELVWYYFAVIQTTTTGIIFFDKVNKVFQNSIFQITKCIQYFYYYSFAFSLVSSAPILIIAFSLNLMDSFIFALIVVGFLFIVMIYGTAMSSLFIRKLIRIYKMDHSEENQQFFDIIKKTTILFFISLTATLINMTMYIITHPFAQSLWNISSIFDIYTNWTCIALSYREFDKQYMKICKPMDWICGRIWRGIIDEDPETRLSQIIEHNCSRSNDDQMQSKSDNFKRNVRKNECSGISSSRSEAVP